MIQHISDVINRFRKQFTYEWMFKSPIAIKTILKLKIIEPTPDILQINENFNCPNSSEPFFDPKSEPQQLKTEAK